VSGDKDFYQLISPDIVLLNPGRGGPAAIDEHWVDQSNASERLGVAPERVIDYLALVGDSSDNIPGVKGVGPKTALELLAAYGDLDGVLAHAADIPGKRAREAVSQYADQARLSRELVTIQRDVPIALDLEALQVRPPDAPRLTELFTELEFRSLIPRLDGLPVARPQARAVPDARAPVSPAPLTPAGPAAADPVIVGRPRAARGSRGGLPRRADRGARHQNLLARPNAGRARGSVARDRREGVVSPVRPRCSRW
jgi:DNA polymerase-1